MILSRLLRTNRYKPVWLSVFMFCFSTFAQDERAQLPRAMQNAYYEVNIGYINYPFSKEQLEPGYTLTSAVEIPHTTLRLVFAGYEFNNYLSAQLSYMRPILWVRYKYTDNADTTEFIHNRTVWMNVGGLTLKPQLPLGAHFTLYGEAGLGIITRHGFEGDDGTPIVTDAGYATFLFGCGIKYHINDHWGLILSTTLSPGNKSVKQPTTSFISAGFSYKLLPVSQEKLDKAAQTGYIHPKQMVQIGYFSNVLGYGVNNLASNHHFPIFWGGNAEVRQGVSLNYKRNVFHTIRVFSLDWGAGTSFWQSNEENLFFFTLSIFPVLRFTFLHTRPLDAYFYYSVAGPTYISETLIDGEDTGKHFTFQDNMGSGVFFGKRRNINVEMKIGHYSNGNIFPENSGVKIPLSLNLGYTF